MTPRAGNTDPPHRIAKGKWRRPTQGILLGAGVLSFTLAIHAQNGEPPAPPIGTPTLPLATKLESPDDQSPPFPIDLPTVLRLADAQNPQIQFARERIRAAEAELERANVLWLPNLAVGTTWSRHDGQIQKTEGNVITSSRSSLFVGGGPSLRVGVADAIYEPLAARQVVAARIAGERVATNDLLLETALGYWELVRQQANIAISQESLDRARLLDERAQSYLRAEKLKPADAERARVELQSRVQERETAQESQGRASIRLARLLRLDPFVRLETINKQLLPVTLVTADAPPRELAALALGNRPELAETQALVRVAQERLRKATYGPLLPSVLLEYRGGGFGGGKNAFFGDFDGTSDFQAGVYWELKGLGFGDRALRRQRDSEIRLAQIQSIAEMDRVVAETADSLARLQSRRRQMDTDRQAVEAATRSYQQNWKLFTDAGIELIRPIEVVQSVQALAKAQQDYLNAVIEYNRAQFQLYWAVGYPVQTASPAK